MFSFSQDSSSSDGLLAHIGLTARHVLTQALAWSTRLTSDTLVWNSFYGIALGSLPSGASWASSTAASLPLWRRSSVAPALVALSQVTLRRELHL